MVQKSDITVLIPVHEWDASVQELITNAVGSVPEGVNISAVIPETLSRKVSSTFKALGINTIKSEGDNNSFQHLINEGVKAVQTDWFSILEFDDVYTPIMFDEFIKYQAYNPNYNVYLPLNDLYGFNEALEKDYIGNGNECIWSAGYADTLGVITNKETESGFNYYLTGGVFRTPHWLSLKESIKLTFWYEYILRMTKAGNNIFVFPKVGYIHNLGRKGSLFNIYKDTIGPDESKFWFHTAKKESHYSYDRCKTYEEHLNQTTTGEDSYEGVSMME